jgi:hypothetical protein
MCTFCLPPLALSDVSSLKCFEEAIEVAVVSE